MYYIATTNQNSGALHKKIIIPLVLGQSRKKYFPDFPKNMKSNKKRKGKFLFTRFFYNL